MDRFEELQKVREASTIEEMKSEILRLERHDPIVSKAASIARFNHLSLEDSMTVLAYHSLKARQEMESLLLDHALSNPMPPTYILTGPRLFKNIHELVTEPVTELVEVVRACEVDGGAVGRDGG